MGQKSFKVNQRVEFNRNTSVSVRGLRYGRVIGSNAKFVRVKLDLTGGIVRVTRDNIKAVK